MPISSDSEQAGVVAALAGRRVDPHGAEQRRFPAENVAGVSGKIRALFAARNATALVCSAACGADLIALDAAERQQMRRRVVLPFSREVFRRTSVVDRPGDWGERYDKALNKLEGENGGLIMLGRHEDDPEAYIAANYAILDQAEQLASELSLGVVAVVVWDERSRGSDDITEQFLNEATRRGLEVLSVSTL